MLNSCLLPMPTSSARLIAVFAGHRFAIMLASLLALLLVAPLFGNDPKSEAEVAMIFSVVVAGLAATSRRRTLALALAVGWVLLLWLRPFGAGTVSSLLIDLVLFGLCSLAVESALRRALGSAAIDAEEICAAVSAYLLLGIAWTALYSSLYAIDAAAFSGSKIASAEAWSSLLYFSFSTLTTLGYGDITPASPTARAWAAAEAVCGTFYLAILIAHLVSNFRAERKAQSTPIESIPRGPRQ